MHQTAQSEIAYLWDLIVKEEEECSEESEDRITAYAHAIAKHQANTACEAQIQLSVLQKMIRRYPYNPDCSRFVESVKLYLEKKHHITGQDVLGGFA